MRARSGTEEETSGAPKQLISDANWQQEITKGSDSTDTSFGKGWTSPHQGASGSIYGRLVVAIGRPKAVIVIVAEQPIFLKTLFKAVSRKRSLARSQPALGQPQEFGDAAGAP